MASGTITKVFGTYWTLIVNWSSTASATTNSSLVSLTASLRTPAISVGTRTCTVNIGGYEQTFTAPAIHKETQTAETFQLGTASQTVYHNADGTKTIGISVYYPINVKLNGTTYKSVTASDSACVLDNIPRRSTLTVAPATGTQLRVGEPINLTVSRSVPAYHEVITFYIGTSLTHIEECDTTLTDTTAAQVTIPASYCSSFLTSSQTATLTVICTTKDSGNNTIGGTGMTYVKTVYIATSAAPTISSASIAPYNGTAPSAFNSLYIRNVSKVRATVSASGNYSATITGYEVVIDGLTGTGASSPVDSALLSQSGTGKTVTVNAVDSRGMRSSETFTIDVLDYSAPTIIPNGGTSVVCARCDSLGTLSETGQYLKVAAIANYSSITGNSVTFSYAVKATTDPDYPSATNFASNIVDGVVSGVSLSIQTSYNVKLTATDTMGQTATYVATISKTTPTFHLKEGGAGAAFGRNAETDNLLDIAWNVRIRGDLQVDGSGGGGGGSNDSVYNCTWTNPTTLTLPTGKTVADIISDYNNGKNVYVILNDSTYYYKIPINYVNGTTVGGGMLTHSGSYNGIAVHAASSGATTMSVERITSSALVITNGGTTTTYNILVTT